MGSLFGVSLHGDGGDMKEEKCSSLVKIVTNRQKTAIIGKGNICIEEIIIIRKHVVKLNKTTSTYRMTTV